MVGGRKQEDGWLFLPWIPAGLAGWLPSMQRGSYLPHVRAEGQTRAAWVHVRSTSPGAQYLLRTYRRQPAFPPASTDSQLRMRLDSIHQAFTTTNGEHPWEQRVEVAGVAPTQPHHHLLNGHTRSPTRPTQN